MTQAWQRLEDVFVGLGFTVAEGPEVETDWFNFEALNMPTSHPARTEWDTMFVDHAGAPAGTTVLRTHTSPVQIRTMLAGEPPLYLIAPGRVFRRDTPDATHMPVFHQIEGLVIDRDINLGHLAGTIEAFTEAYFGPGFTSRLRPSYFPFTEPSGEFDIRQGDGRWLELGGLWNGPSPSARRRRHRPRGVERVRFRLRNRPYGQGTSRCRRPARDVHRRHSLRGAVLVEISRNWLANYAPIPDDIELLAATLNSLGIEVDDVTHVGGVPGVVTARVTRIERHPDAAKVIRVWIDTGDGRRASRVVRGVELRAW